MPPVARTRETIRGGGGDFTTSWTYLGNPGTSTRFNGYKRCEDVVGNFGNPNPLLITDVKTRGGLLNWDGNLKCEGKPCSLIPRLPAYSTPNPAGYLNRILSQSGPLTPDVYLPLSVFELRELPQLVKSLGDFGYGIKDAVQGFGKVSPGKGAANHYLTGQFGIAPVVGDIAKLCQFADLVKRRQRMLRDAHSRDGIRRRVTLEKRTIGPVNGTVAVHSTMGAIVQQDYTASIETEAWATITWKLRDLSQIGKTPSFQEAFRVALGLNKGYIPIMVWKALPWTWMTDWFLNISQILQANHNRVYYQPSTVCVMRHTKGETNYHFKGNLGGKPQQFVTAGQVLNETKARSIHAPNNQVNLRMPFLDPFKLSILGSLAVLKLR